MQELNETPILLDIMVLFIVFLISFISGYLFNQSNMKHDIEMLKRKNKLEEDNKKRREKLKESVVNKIKEIMGSNNIEIEFKEIRNPQDLTDFFDDKKQIQINEMHKAEYDFLFKELTLANAKGFDESSSLDELRKLYRLIIGDEE